MKVKISQAISNYPFLPIFLIKIIELFKNINKFIKDNKEA
jgi:hypothetical protein